MQGEKTILVVDDDLPILDSTVRLLTPHGYRVLTAKNGEEALTIYNRRGREIDLVLLDMGMPGMDGLDCLKALAAINRAVKVIVVTGYTNREAAEESLEAGALEYLGKPYQLDSLLDLMRVVLGG